MMNSAPVLLLAFLFIIHIQCIPPRVSICLDSSPKYISVISQDLSTQKLKPMEILMSANHINPVYGCRTTSNTTKPSLSLTK